MKMLIFLNGLLALASIAAALLACFRPTLMSRSSAASDGERFYARMYASRALPAGVLTLLAPWCWQGSAVSAVLLTAAAMQLGDALIGWQKREWGMVIFPLLAAGVHIATSVLFFS
ncbi:MAG: hypothetical protein Q4D61_02465 [Cardiobacteriaceae bacterium]|nr:hypothetical protein [Cardiobacteriaceae bacterium]